MGRGKDAPRRTQTVNERQKKISSIAIDFCFVRGEPAAQQVDDAEKAGTTLVYVDCDRIDWKHLRVFRSNDTDYPIESNIGEFRI